MMSSHLPLLVLALSAALVAPAALDEDYPMIVPQKRAALVLDRLLIALQKALHEGGERAAGPRTDPGDGADPPRVAPLRVPTLPNDMMGLEAGAGRGGLDYDLGPRAAPLRLAAIEDDTSALQRRGQGGTGRGRVLRCYFNAVTCF